MRCQPGLCLLPCLLIFLTALLNTLAARTGLIHYKTTYACEGFPLHLSCEPGRLIHLVRANYGRFSISTCNDKGRLDLSVQCMSYRSFLIMQDRCSQKSNCSVTVSSKLFGDPCPGTDKYLEVQYHCVHGGPTTTRRPPINNEMQTNVYINFQPPNNNNLNADQNNSMGSPISPGLESGSAAMGGLAPQAVPAPPMAPNEDVAALSVAVAPHSNTPSANRDHGSSHHMVSPHASAAGESSRRGPSSTTPQPSFAVNAHRPALKSETRDLERDELWENSNRQNQAASSSASPAFSLDATEEELQEMPEDNGRGGGNAGEWPSSHSRSAPSGSERDRIASSSASMEERERERDRDLSAERVMSSPLPPPHMPGPPSAPRPGTSSVSLAVTCFAFVFFLAALILFICVVRMDSVQHKLIQNTRLGDCLFPPGSEEDCAAAKGHGGSTVVHSSAYGASPIVTQVATQVPVIGSPGSGGSVVSPYGFGPQLMPSSHLQPWSSSLEKNNLSSTHDRQSTLASPIGPRDHGLHLGSTHNISHGEGINNLLKSGTHKKMNAATTGPILVNPVLDATSTLDVTLDEINRAALNSTTLADYESKIKELRNNSLPRKERRRKTQRPQPIQDPAPRYAVYPNISTNPNFNQLIDHIYESIDSDSYHSLYGSRGVYGRSRAQVNELYGTRPLAADDEYSANSASSSYGVYDERPLLVTGADLLVLANGGHSPVYNLHHSQTSPPSPASPAALVQARLAALNQQQSQPSPPPPQGAAPILSVAARRDALRASKNSSFLISRSQQLRQASLGQGQAGDELLPDLLQYPCDSPSDEVSSKSLARITVNPVADSAYLAANNNNGSAPSPRTRSSPSAEQQQNLSTNSQSKLSTYC